MIMTDIQVFTITTLKYYFTARIQVKYDMLLILFISRQQMTLVLPTSIFTRSKRRAANVIAAP